VNFSQCTGTGVSLTSGWGNDIMAHQILQKMSKDTVENNATWLYKQSNLLKRIKWLFIALSFFKHSHTIQRNIIIHWYIIKTATITVITIASDGSDSSSSDSVPVDNNVPLNGITVLKETKSYKE
jgi:hypothetical protein